MARTDKEGNLIGDNGFTTPFENERVNHHSYYVSYLEYQNMGYNDKKIAERLSITLEMLESIVSDFGGEDEEEY